ncbi:MAG: hypothetical protein BAA01_15920 [Bacillus thermozeamaize]|uniref:DUF4367 domain-containing protein n=1 Tax=Bacillus thermozeamaize TaxID=230954 RepID=A0A1Y3PSL4_9BACI|nr:MAG: hypothetical protein BAA01_15920 [Bacillus thermozeamaize]
MRQTVRIIAIVVGAFLLLAGCGGKSADGVVSDLTKRTEKLKSYHATGVLTLHTSEQPRVYHVEVSYKEPHYYRVSLSNKEQDISQIILRNDEGVFVLTPSVNRSFRFRSDWPNSNPQPYLYETLVQDIIKDKERRFEKKEHAYVFETKTNYQNRTLASQRIWLNPKDYTPLKVEALDSSGNLLVVMEFEKFTANAEVDANEFQLEKNMSLGTDKEAVPTASKASDKTRSFGIILPKYLPEGVKLKEEAEVMKGDSRVVILKYDGAYKFTLLEQRPEAATVHLPFGEPVDLGHSIGVFMSGEQQTLQWMTDGVEYQLSGNLPLEEMIRVAQSVAGSVGK